MMRFAKPLVLLVALYSSHLSAQLVAVASPTKRTVFSATGLPPGISIDPKTGVISGTFDRSAIVDGNMTYDAVVKVEDVNGGAGSLHITIKVPNEVPTANDDDVAVQQGTMSTIPVLANDGDLDGDTLVIVSVHSDATPVQSFGAAGIQYRSSAKPGTIDRLNYVVSDGHGGIASAYVYVTINPVP
jgi:hypothetical protein